MRSFLWVLSGSITISFALLVPACLNAQEPDSLRADPDAQQIADTLPQAPDSVRGITPGGAFLRSALIPGWGHTRVGAQGRGAFYFAAEALTTFMILKTQSRLSLARDRRELWESVVTQRLTAEAVEQGEEPPDPLELEAALEEDERVAELRGLEDARSEQREDWIALGIFFLFLGGADAYVSAHLAEFPAPVEVNVEGAPPGAVEISLWIPSPFPWDPR